MQTLLRKCLPSLLFLLLGIALAFMLVPRELEQMHWEVPGMPESYPLEQLFRPILLLVLSFLPFIGSLIYVCMGTMDRYISRNFINYFLLCTLILLVIYTLADFTANMEKFRTRFDNPLLETFVFYGTQLPMFLYQILPYTLFLGALWCLSRLSGTSELTGMLQSGRSLVRLCVPIFIFSALGALAYGIFGFHWAPNGFLYRQIMLKQEQREDGSEAPIVYRSDAQSRIWRIARPAGFSDPGRPMEDVIIEQFDPKNPGKLILQYIAESAVWNKQDATWTLHNAYVRDLEHARTERPGDEAHHGELVCAFDEKPYQIISPATGGRVDSMGTSAMYEFIASGSGSREDRRNYRTEWHVRIARIFSCIVLVLLAIPSSVTFQRRGAMKGIGIAILLAALMLFCYRVFPSLGASGLLPAWLSAWLPNIIYICVALYLFRRNLAHRSFREWLSAKVHGRP
ncbi:MAG TPA: LptF/LptG family permease [Candidatus Akkermansia intestinigallinarum]|uniref:LptF/LptG family permease n=1 Tax=Candidatus Akkermansia intestinigallinarum TaxID=2838431 RepID=A0A9D1V9W3_9BACT|nr:LptF/LptG family permease [Candidatus Akkermansia intestinigallinarum]